VCDRISVESRIPFNCRINYDGKQHAAVREPETCI